MRRRGNLLAVILTLAAFGQGHALAQADSGEPASEQAPRSRTQMTLITPGLIQIGQTTSFFMEIADQLTLSDDQRATLEEHLFEYQTYKVGKLADLNVTTAELNRLMTRERIDLNAIRAKLTESKSISIDVQMREIELLLEAISLLTHEQHLRIVALYQTRQDDGPRIVG